MIKMMRRIISLLIIFSLIFQQTGFTQAAAELNIASRLASLHNSFAIDKFRPLHLRYLQYLPQENNFKLLLDKGDEFSVPHPSSLIPRNDSKLDKSAAFNSTNSTNLTNAAKDLLKYFYIGLTLPNSSFWVNLRPDAEDNIIDEYLSKTDIGRVMLETDLQLKKDTASFTSPQTPEGREYWDKLYKKAEELYGNENLTIPTLTRPWIVPGEIILRETRDDGRGTAPSAYIYKATLKVMLESDYLKSTNSTIATNPTYQSKDARSKALNDYSTQLIRELIIPKLTKAVNSSKRYAPLRQVYYSLILAQWFKARNQGLSPHKATQAQAKGTVSDLIDSKNLTNLISKDPWSKTTYFNAYKQSFSQGEYNVSEPVYTHSGQVIRSYFSGGENLVNITGSSMMVISVSTATPLTNNLINVSEVVSSPLDVLRDETTREFILELFRKYYKNFDYPYSCIPRIVDLLIHHLDNPEAAVAAVFAGFPRNIDRNSDFAQGNLAIRSAIFSSDSDLIKPYVKGSVLVDVGAKDTRFIEALVKIEPTIKKAIATDIKPAGRVAHDSKCSFQLQSNPDKLSFESSSVDTITISRTLHHIDPLVRKRLLASIVDTLKPGGRLIIIEDSYPQWAKEDYKKDELTRKFLNFPEQDKRNIMVFIDWWGSRLMGNNPDVYLPLTFECLEYWQQTLEDFGLLAVEIKFLGFLEAGSLSRLPKVLFVFERPTRKTDDSVNNGDGSIKISSPPASNPAAGPAVEKKIPKYGDPDFWPGKMKLTKQDLVNLGVKKSSFSGEWVFANIVPFFKEAPPEVQEMLKKKLSNPYRTHKDILKARQSLQALLDMTGSSKNKAESLDRLNGLLNLIEEYYEFQEKYYKELRELRSYHYPYYSIRFKRPFHKPEDYGELFPDVTPSLIALGQVIRTLQSIDDALPNDSSEIIQKWKGRIEKTLARTELKPFLEKNKFLEAVSSRYINPYVFVAPATLEKHKKSWELFRYQYWGKRWKGDYGNGLREDTLALHDELRKRGDLNDVLEEFSKLAKELSDLWVLNVGSQAEEISDKEDIVDKDELSDDDLFGDDFDSIYSALNDLRDRKKKPHVKASGDKRSFLRQFPNGIKQSPLTEIDYYARIARFVLESDYKFADIIQPTGSIKLSSLRNPILFGKGNSTSIQPISMNLDGLNNALLLSGPNMGGKTTTARGIGLSVLLTQIGLPIPDDAPELAVFRNIYTVFPRPEQLQPGYGYFGMLIKELTGLINKSGPGDLVILDEVPIGTDYEELVAIATVLTEDLINTGATVIVTGHLKKAFELIAERSGQQPYMHTAKKKNGRIIPDFHLEPGIAKHSYAIELMGEAGFPKEIVELARAYYKVITEGPDAAKIPILSLPEKMVKQEKAQEQGATAGKSAFKMLERVAMRVYPASNFAFPHTQSRVIGELTGQIDSIRTFAALTDEISSFSGQEKQKDVSPASENESASSEDDTAWRLRLSGLFCAQGSAYLEDLHKLLVIFKEINKTRANRWGAPAYDKEDYKIKLDLLEKALKALIAHLAALKDDADIGRKVNKLEEALNKIPELREQYLTVDKANLDKDQLERSALEWLFSWESLLNDMAISLLILDEFTGIARSIIQNGLTPPKFSDKSNIFSLKNSLPFFPGSSFWGSDEPFVKNGVKQSFMANPQKPVLVLTGPNSSGKSVLMFNSYLNSLFALNGFYVSGDFETSRFDNVYAFFGGENLTEAGESYFFNILRQYADIIRQVTPNSLVILDELHGTDNFELAAIQVAVLHYLRSISCTAIFNTHIRDGLKIADKKVGLDFWQTDVDYDKAKNKVEPFFSISRDLKLEAKSYGLEIASQWLSADQMARAKEILSQLNNTEPAPLLPIVQDANNPNVSSPLDNNPAAGLAEDKLILTPRDGILALRERILEFIASKNRVLEILVDGSWSGLGKSTLIKSIATALEKMGWNIDKGIDNVGNTHYELSMAGKFVIIQQILGKMELGDFEGYKGYRTIGVFLAKTDKAEELPILVRKHADIIIDAREESRIIPEEMSRLLKEGNNSDGSIKDTKSRVSSPLDNNSAADLAGLVKTGSFLSGVVLNPRLTNSQISQLINPPGFYVSRIIDRPDGGIIIDSQEKGWPIFNTSFSEVDSTFGKVFTYSSSQRLKIGLLANIIHLAKVKKDKGEILYVLEWGVGDFTAAKELAKKLYELSLDNVQIIAFGDTYPPNIKELPRNIVFIVDVAKNLYVQINRIFPGAKIDIIYGYESLYMVTDYFEYLRDISKLLSREGFIVYNGIIQSDYFQQEFLKNVSGIFNKVAIYKDCVLLEEPRSENNGNGSTKDATSKVSSPLGPNPVAGSVAPLQAGSPAHEKEKEASQISNTEEQVRLNERAEIALRSILGHALLEYVSRMFAGILTNVSRLEVISEQAAPELEILGTYIPEIEYDLRELRFGIRNNTVTGVQLFIQLVGMKEKVLAIQENLKNRLESQYSTNKDYIRLMKFLTELVDIFKTQADFIVRSNIDEEIDTNTVIAESVPLISKELTNYYIQYKGIGVRLESGLPKVKANARLMKRALGNIISNAADAVFSKKAEGQITVDTKIDLSGKCILVIIRDNGIGIAPKMLEEGRVKGRPKIFDLNVSTQEGGGGLGLTEALDIVSDAGGTIDVQSEVGKGTIFTIKLPFVRDANSPEVSSPPDADPAAGPKLSSSPADIKFEHLGNDKFTDIAKVKEWYQDMLIDDFGKDHAQQAEGDLYRFLISAAHPSIENMQNVLGWVWDADYYMKLSKMSIPEMLEEYERLGPNEYVHKTIGLGLLDIVSPYFNNHLYGRTIETIIGFQDFENDKQLSELMIKKYGNQFIKQYRYKAEWAKKKILFYHQWIYRHWDGRSKQRLNTLLNLKAIRYEENKGDGSIRNYSPLDANSAGKTKVSSGPARSYWQGRTFIQIDPDDNRYAFALKHGLPEELNREAQVMLAANNNGLQGFPMPVANEQGDYVYRFGEGFVLRYRVNIDRLHYLTDLKEYPNKEDISGNKQKLMDAALKNMQELGNLFSLGYIHTSLLELSHHEYSFGWSWDYDEDFTTIGSISDISPSMRYPNLRIGGISDFEHVVPFGLEDIEHHLGQNFTEVILSVAYTGVKIGLSDNEICEIIQKGIEQFGSSFYSGGLPEEFISGLRFFVGGYRREIERHDARITVYTGHLLPLFSGIRTLINRYKETDFFKNFLPVSFKYYAVNQGDVENGQVNRDGVALWQGSCIIDPTEVDREQELRFLDATTRQLIMKHSLPGVWLKALAFSKDKIFVVDKRQDKVLILNKDLKEIGSFNKLFYWPKGITILGNKVFVLDFDDNVSVFEPNGNWLFSFGKRGGAKESEFSDPVHILAFTNKIVVVERGNNRLQVFDEEGKFSTKWGDNGELRAPTMGMVLLGKLFILDNGDTRVQIFDKNGSLLKSVPKNTIIQLEPEVYIRYIDHRPARPFIQVIRPAIKQLFQTYLASAEANENNEVDGSIKAAEPKVSSPLASNSAAGPEVGKSEYPAAEASLKTPDESKWLFQSYEAMSKLFDRIYQKEQGWLLLFDTDRSTDASELNKKLRELNSIIVERFREYKTEFFSTHLSGGNVYKEEGFIYIPEDLAQEDIIKISNIVKEQFTERTSLTVSISAMKFRDTEKAAQEGLIDGQIEQYKRSTNRSRWNMFIMDSILWKLLNRSKDEGGDKTILYNPAVTKNNGDGSIKNSSPLGANSAAGLEAENFKHDPHWQRMENSGTQYTRAIADPEQNILRCLDKLGHATVMEGKDAVPVVPDGSSILVVGFGERWQELITFANKFPRCKIIGADWIERNIAAAKQNCNRENIELIQDDIRNADLKTYPPARLVFLSYVIERRLYDGDEEAMSQIAGKVYNILEDGGFVISLPSGNFISSIFKRLGIEPLITESAGLGTVFIGRKPLNQLHTVTPRLEEIHSAGSPVGGIDGSASSPLMPQEVKSPGGIDFRSLPIVTQAMSNLSNTLQPGDSFRSLNRKLALRKLSPAYLNKEWQEIERVVSSGITPSPERIKEYLQASCAKGDVLQDKDKVILCIADILRSEEETCCVTDPTLRDILVVLEASGSSAELSRIFLG